ncbi:MoaD/ThiS family protein [Mycoplasma sp. P36-A1]|uniref:MoaD/ThiS family protein n=1 Tax=Mycoplasma sp. P36-A1 TaxID=3252900 RepID=UPI003C2FCFC2
MIEVKLFASFRVNREKIMYIEYTENMNIKDVAKKLAINEKEIAISLINGKHAPLDSILKDKDKVFLFPPVGGG